MKTLDEAIKALEECMVDDAIESEGVYLATDALHYLKEFKRYQNTPSCNGHMALVDYFEESQKNEPLTWEELKQMEGRPVWVESSDSFNRRRWMFVGEWFDDDEMRLFDMECDYPDYVSKNGYESGTWQAYRKERK